VDSERDRVTQEEEEEVEEEEEEEGSFKANAVNEKDPERDRATPRVRHLLPSQILPIFQ
jgi:hypothetical protein